MALKERQLDLGPSKDKCLICKETEKKGESYEDFFTEDERRELDAIAVDYPSYMAMLPPMTGKFFATSGADATATRRKDWHQKKHNKRNKNKTRGEFHHPRPIGAGGCPLHQDPFVEKAPDDANDAKRQEEADTAVQKIVDGAINRARAAR